MFHIRDPYRCQSKNTRADDCSLTGVNSVESVGSLRLIGPVSSKQKNDSILRSSLGQALLTSHRLTIH